MYKRNRTNVQNLIRFSTLNSKIDIDELKTIVNIRYDDEYYLGPIFVSSVLWSCREI